MRHIAIPRRRSLITALALGALLLVVGGSPVVPHAFAQESGLTLVNQDESFIQRHDHGGFTARPVLSAEADAVAYGVKDPIDGAWLTAFYFVEDKPRKVNRGWEYTFDYPPDDSQPELDPERAYILGILAWLDDESYLFEAIIPMHESTGLWDGVINALNPARWARAGAGWVIEGIHGLMCSVLGRIAGGDLEDC